MAEIPLSLGGLFGQNMAKVLFFILNLPRTGKGITLGGAFFGFHFWHKQPLLDAGALKYFRFRAALFFWFWA
jgi:hypothetical protein